MHRKKTLRFFPYMGTRRIVDLPDCDLEAEVISPLKDNEKESKRSMPLWDKHPGLQNKVEKTIKLLQKFFHTAKIENKIIKELFCKMRSSTKKFAHIRSKFLLADKTWLEKDFSALEKLANEIKNELSRELAILKIEAEKIYRANTEEKEFNQEHFNHYFTTKIEPQVLFFRLDTKKEIVNRWGELAEDEQPTFPEHKLVEPNGTPCYQLIFEISNYEKFQSWLNNKMRKLNMESKEETFVTPYRIMPVRF